MEETRTPGPAESGTAGVPAVAPGVRLGSYVVRARLGQGGMGVVWRATDSSLGRDVALKVLPDEFTRDAERLSRFEREAKLLASLNHPNIAQIYGLEVSGPTRALVMELVEGPTLAERIERGPLPLDEALGLARQIAEALEDAHDKGIVHRDLKPQNVKLTSDGRIKVLDFGLAKAMEPSRPGNSPSLIAQSPTLSGTLQGAILGTAAYMAPEQAAGLTVDRRADIWAFGVVLYEMLTGRPLFEGETVTHLLAAVMKDEPNLEALPAATPPAVRDLIRRCLRKKPRERLQAIGDARLVLEEVANPSSAPSPSAASSPVEARRPAPRRVFLWGLLVALFLLGVVALVRPRAAVAPGAVGPITRFTLLPEQPGEIDGYPALSPDGRTLVYGLADSSGVTRLWAHSFETGETRLLPGTEHAEDAFWSPDGRWIGYFSKGWLRKLEVATGLSENLAAASDPRGGGWSDTGEIFFTPNSSAGLYKVPAAGGTPVRVIGIDPARQEGSHRYPVPLPGGRSLVFTSLGAQRRGSINWLRLDGQARPLLPDFSRVAYDPRGYLLWVHQGALVAQKFDPERGELSGNPFPIAERVGVDAQKTARSYFGASGGIVALRVGLDWLSQLKWYDRSGQVLGEVTSPGYFDEVTLSADASRVVVTRNNAANEVDTWIYDATGKDRGTRVTFEGSGVSTWAPDGRRVCYSTAGAGGWQLACRPADGSGEEEKLALLPGTAVFDSGSRRDPLMAFDVFSEEGGQDIWLLPLDGDKTPKPFLQTPAAEGHASFSPDGRLLAYASDEGGLPQIYVQEIGGARSRWQVTTDGADEPSWRADGGEMYYIGLDRVLYAVPVKSLAPFSVGEPKRLFPLHVPLLAMSGSRSAYSPAPDGRRFLVNTRLGDESEPGFRVIMNWSPPDAGDGHPR
jgi:eukaryotic-like serine/threonine-protein kinase